MRITTDYHMHTTFSPDAHDTMEAMCWRALALGFTEIALTEHAEWVPRWQWAKGFPKIDAYFAEIERCRAEFAPRGLSVLSGVELGNPHEYAAEALQLVNSYPFDVRTASLHWLYGQNIHDASCFAGREPLEVYADYFIALGRMAADFGPIDLVAHFDRILWRGSILGAKFDEKTLEGPARDALATVAWRGLALELNTRLLDYKPNWRGTLATMLRWFREEGGQRVVVNSDAHRTGQMGLNLDLAAEVLRDAGLEPSRLPLLAEA